MEIVSFELAKKLKAKKYPQDIETHNTWYAIEYYKNSCLGEYFEGELTNTYEYGDKINALHIVETENKGVVAPTISQVLKWLREEKRIVFGIVPMQEIDGDYLSWCATIYKVDDNGYGLSWQEELYYQTYETVTIAGIEYVLDNLI